MARVPASPLIQRIVVAAAGLCAWFLIVSLSPASRSREFALFSLLLLTALVPLSLIVYEYSRKMLRAMTVARREHELFRLAAEGSMKAFALCKPVCNRNKEVRDFRITYANASAARLLGWKRQTLSRQSIRDVLTSPPGDSVFAVLLRVLETGKKEQLRTHRVSGSAKAEMLEMEVESVGSCLALSLKRQDVAEVTPEKVHELEEFAQSMVENAPISMIATDASGLIVAMNAAAEELTLYGREELVQRHSMTLLHDPLELRACHDELGGSAAGFEALCRTMELEGESAREWTYLRKDGSRACVSLTVVALKTSSDRVTGHLAIGFDVTERRRLTDSVTHLSRYDQLTGLGNRTLLKDQLVHGIARAEAQGQTLAVLVIDLDYFKRVNDLLGHGAGDQVLVSIARQLNGALSPLCAAARTAGDEFVVLMANAGPRAEVEQRAGELLGKVRAPVLIAGREVQMTASVGVCVFPEDAATGPELLRNADVAMHQAKSEGRNCVRLFSAEMQREAADRLEMEEDLRHALGAGEFELHYQPQVSGRTGCVTGMEMLLRWRSAKRGNVPPNVFIPIAEQAGLMPAIGEWSVRQACLDCARMSRELGRELRMAVNLSPRQVNQRNLTGMIRRALTDAGLPPNQFEIEITEEILMADSVCLRETLQELRGLGVTVAIDDFGTGFSSFSYILRYRVDRIKIDRSFVSRLNQDGQANAIVRAILTMGRGLHLELVAEGVETEPQLQFLLRRQCDSIQGFFFSKPVPIAQFAQTTLGVEEHARDYIRPRPRPEVRLAGTSRPRLVHPSRASSN